MGAACSSAEYAWYLLLPAVFGEPAASGKPDSNAIKIFYVSVIGGAMTLRASRKISFPIGFCFDEGQNQPSGGFWDLSRQKLPKQVGNLFLPHY
jgi:hypothetical protein